jgi:FixJ family two-component response regulator
MDNSAHTIFVVDDDESVLRALGRLLESRGFKVRLFSTAADFLKTTGSQDQACVISDIWMDGISGLDIPQKMRAAGCSWPVIFITARDTDEARQQAKMGGAAGYFRKPIDTEALLDAIHWAMSGRNETV